MRIVDGKVACIPGTDTISNSLDSDRDGLSDHEESRITAYSLNPDTGALVALSNVLQTPINQNNVRLNYKLIMIALRTRFLHTWNGDNIESYAINNDTASFHGALTRVGSIFRDHSTLISMTIAPGGDLLYLVGVNNIDDRQESGLNAYEVERTLYREPPVAQ